MIQKLVNSAIEVDFENDLNTKIEDCIQELKKRIEEELDCIKGYEVEIVKAPQEPICKDKVIRRAYKILRKKMRNH